MSTDGGELVSGWVRAAGDPAVVADLLAVFASVAEEVARRAPVCRFD